MTPDDRMRVEHLAEGLDEFHPSDSDAIRAALAALDKAEENATRWHDSWSRMKQAHSDVLFRAEKAEAENARLKNEVWRFRREFGSCDACGAHWDDKDGHAPACHFAASPPTQPAPAGEARELEERFHTCWDSLHHAPEEMRAKCPACQKETP